MDPFPSNPADPGGDLPLEPPRSTSSFVFTSRKASWARHIPEPGQAPVADSRSSILAPRLLSTHALGAIHALPTRHQLRNIDRTLNDSTPHAPASVLPLQLPIRPADHFNKSYVHGSGSKIYAQALDRSLESREGSYSVQPTPTIEEDHLTAPRSKLVAFHFSSYPSAEFSISPLEVTLEDAHENDRTAAHTSFRLKPRRRKMISSRSYVIPARPKLPSPGKICFCSFDPCICVRFGTPSSPPLRRHHTSPDLNRYMKNDHYSNARSESQLSSHSSGSLSESQQSSSTSVDLDGFTISSALQTPVIGHQDVSFDYGNVAVVDDTSPIAPFVDLPFIELAPDREWIKLDALRLESLQKTPTRDQSL